MPGEDSLYKDLLGFLQSNRSDLRLAASEAVVGVTDGEGMSNLIKHGIIAPLCRLSSRSSEASTSVNALAALVQLSSNGSSINQCVEDLLENKGISRMTEIALSQPEKDGDNSGADGGSSLENWKKRVNYAMALLANMTRTERGAVELSGFITPVEAIPTSNNSTTDVDENNDIDSKMPSKPTLALLTARFLSSAYIEEKEEIEGDEDTNQQELEANHNDPYQHFAAVLMNVTQVEQGRRFVMKVIHNKNDNKIKPSSILQQIIPLLRSPNAIRRRGLAGTVKNCCFEKNSAWWLINEVDIIPKLLYMLAGPEEMDMDEKKGMDPDLWLEGPDKIRESDQTTRLLLVECILLLCASGRKSRESLRVQRAYVILKYADMVEEFEDVSERINECVQFIRRDEQDTEEGSSDRFVDESINQMGINGNLLALPAPSAADQVGGQIEESYDNVD